MCQKHAFTPKNKGKQAAESITIDFNQMQFLRKFDQG